MVEARQDLGLTVLTSSAVFGAWSAWNSSLFTAATFVDNKDKLSNAILAMNLGLATAFATGAGVYYVYGEKGKVAAAAAGITGLVLYAAYYLKLKSNPKLNGFMTDKLSNLSTSNTLEWKPLSDKEINNIRNLINNSRINIISEP